MIPALVIVADALWQEVYPGPLHVLAGEIARRHRVIWLEPPVWQCLKAPGLGPRLRRALRLDLPRVHYLDGARELDVLTPPAWPAGQAGGDALLVQTVRWVLKGYKLHPAALWVARRDAAGAALARALKPDVVVDHHPEPAADAPWLEAADLVLWPEGLALPPGVAKDDPRRYPLGPGVKGALALAPMVTGWLERTPPAAAPAWWERLRLPL